MKKAFLIISLLLAAACHCRAQDTITGVVSRVGAPYFEQNACDSRFAINTEDETYYVMVDGYWPNPYVEDLVIHYDTIPVGNEIEVVGMVVDMVDGNGEVFRVIDIQKLINAENVFFYSCIYWMGDFYPIAFPSLDTINAFATYLDDGTLCFIIIDGTLQTDYEWLLNDLTIQPDQEYLFVGSYETWMDFNDEPFMVFILKAAFPYSDAPDSSEGTLFLDENLCLVLPNSKTHYLSVFDGICNNYLTINGLLLHNYINSDIFKDHSHVRTEGIKTTRYDLFGNPFNSLEIIELQQIDECSLYGKMQDAPMPSVGIAVPGMVLAFYSGDYHYYLDNSIIIDNAGLEAIVIESDTISYGNEITAKLKSKLKIESFFEPYYCIFILEATATNSLQEELPIDLSIYPNPTNGTIYIISKNTIGSISVYDSKGKNLINRYIHSKTEKLFLDDTKGIIMISVEFKDGNKTTKKILVR